VSQDFHVSVAAQATGRNDLAGGIGFLSAIPARSSGRGHPDMRATAAAAGCATPGVSA
jgi:hypothetical protein